MSRAILMIGVSTTASNHFAALQDVQGSIGRVDHWASSQGIKLKTTLTDVANPLEVDAIKDAIRKLIDENDNLEQLIVYFSGHGVVNAYNEYWLLSRAPDDPNAAINVEASIAQARMGPVPHVVFISDACRNATNDLATGRISGSSIFDTLRGADFEQAVDVFFATKLGAPALEIKVGEDPPGNHLYRSVFSEVLVDGLENKLPNLKPDADGFIRPRALKDALKTAVPERLIARNLPTLVSQAPDARITSGVVEWVAEFGVPPQAGAPGRPAEMPAPPAPPHPPPHPRPPEAQAAAPPILRSREAAEILVRDALTGQPPETLEGLRERTGRALSENATVMMRRVESAVRPPPATEDAPAPERRTGFQVHGSACKAFVSAPMRIGPSGRGDEFAIDGQGPGQALLVFDESTSMLLPVIPDYVGVVDVADGVVREVVYEPAPRWQAADARADTAQLRTAALEASARGVFALEPEGALQLAQRMQSSKFLDPALAVYAAYAYHDLGDLAHIREMCLYLRSKLHIAPFDAAMLAREFIGETAPRDVYPAAPLLAQGWALVDVLCPRFDDALHSLRARLTRSLWSQYDAEGTQLLSNWIGRNGDEP